MQNHWLFSSNNIYFCNCQKLMRKKLKRTSKLREELNSLHSQAKCQLIQTSPRADPGFWNGGRIVVIFGVNFWQCVCGLKMNKLIGRTSHRLCTFSTSIREIKYYFDIWGIRKQKKKEGSSVKKGGGWKFTHFTSPGSAPENPKRQHTYLNHLSFKAMSKHSVFFRNFE